jgi:uncharacterized FAD-dependent dehydrogenase
MQPGYDVIIVGAGPAGIFAALELVRRDGMRVLMLEKGQDVEHRSCPARISACRRCDPCSITCGWGGAGAFSDGKLTLSPEIGGWLGDYVGQEKLVGLIDEADRLFLEFGAPSKTFGEDDKYANWQKRAVLADLQLMPNRVRHLGTDRCKDVLVRIGDFLRDHVEVRNNTEVAEVLTRDGAVTGVLTTGGEEIAASRVVLAPGREGAEWLSGMMEKLGGETQANPVDIGLRVEVPAPVLDPITDELYEPKLVYHSRNFEDRVRTFCMNPHGVVCVERYGDVLTVNGHSYSDERSDFSNFAILVSTAFTEPFREPIAYGKYIARLANLLGEGILVQRLGDLETGRRSTRERIDRSTVTPTLADATPGDLSFVLPYRHLADILEMLRALDNMIPGLYSRNTLLYGVEVKFYSARHKLDENLQTHIRNLYAVGDGAGITRGLIQASVSGLIAARSILGG